MRKFIGMKGFVTKLSSEVDFLGARPKSTPSDRKSTPPSCLHMGFTASQPHAGCRPKNLENLAFRKCSPHVR